LVTLVGLAVWLYNPLGENDPKLRWEDKADKADCTIRSAAGPPQRGGGTATQLLLGTAGSLPSRATTDAGRETISTNMSSPLGSGWLARTCTPSVALQLPTPLIVRAQAGECFTLSGPVSSQRQEDERVDIRRSANNGSGVVTQEAVARIHIAEDDKGSGILMEFVTAAVPYPRVVPFAFLDTAFAGPVAGGGSRQSEAGRQVSIFGASRAGWDAAALPSAVVKAIGTGRFAMLQNGQVILTVIAKDHQLSHVEGKDAQLLARIQSTGNGLTVQCSSGADGGVVLCAVVACVKLL